MRAVRFFLPLCFMTACGPKVSDGAPTGAIVASPETRPVLAADVVVRTTAEPPDATSDGNAETSPADIAVVGPMDVVAMPAPLPPDLPTIAGLTPAVVARALDPTPGCVGLAKNGRGVLVIEESAAPSRAESQEVLRYIPFRANARFPDESAPGPLVTARGADWAAAVRAAATEGALALPKTPLDACHVAAAVDGAARVAKAIPIAVASYPAERAIVASIEGNAPVRIELDGVGAARVTAAYWADATDALVLALEEVDATPRRTTWALVGPSELGNSACLPLANAPVAPLSPPALAAEGHCLAMTPDGKGAAFEIASGDVQWFGVAPRAAAGGELAVGCLARGCPRDSEAEIARAGLVGCGTAAGSIVVDGHPFELGTHGVEVRLRVGQGWRSIAHLGPEERLERTFQHPSGGPVYLWLRHSYTEQLRNGARRREENRVRVVPSEALVGCSVSAGTLWGVAARASSSEGAKPTAKFGANALVDGDLTTSWQAAKPKPNAAPPWVELALPEATEVAAVEIANGYQRRDGYGDLFAMNARVAAATLEFDDGSREELTFDANDRGLKRFDFAPRRTATIKLTVTARHAGARWPDDLNISEVRVIATAGR